MDDLKVGIVVEANSAGVGSGLRPGLLAIRDFDTQSGRHLKSLQDKMTATRGVISNTFASLSTNQKLFAGFGVGIAFVGTALAKSIGPAIQFESAFAGVKKTVDGTPEQLASIRQGILDMSKVMPTAADELASIAENAGQLGVKAPDVLEFTRVIAELGETTDLSFDDAAQSLARFLNITGSGASGIGKVSDVIVKLGNNSATTESQIVDFSTRLASAFTVAGASEDQILAVASAFSSMGIQAEAGGSALSRVITVIGDAAIDGGKELQVLAETAGLTTEEFRRLAAEDPTQALVLFAQGLGRIRDEGGSLTGTFDDLELGGLRTSEVLRLAAINSDLLVEQLGLASNAYEIGGARAEEYGKRIETTASRIEIFKNRLNTAAIALGTPLLDGVARSVDLAGDAVERLLEIMAPLGQQIFEVFKNGAELAELFFQALGGPALKIAVAALIGATSILTDLLSVLNSLGPAGLAVAVLAADLYFVGPASIAAAKGLDTVGASGLRAAAGAKAASLAVSTGPWVVAIGVLALLGKAYLDAGDKAKKAGDEWENSFNRAVENSDFAGVEASLASITKRQEELADKTGRSGSKWDEFLFGFKTGASGGLLGTVQEVVGLNKELDTLNDRLESTQADNYRDGIKLIAEALGVTEDEAIALAGELGAVDEVTRLGADALQGYGLANRAVVEEMREHVTAVDDLADKTGIAREKILDGSATLTDYGTALGVTTDQLGFLAEKIDGVDLDDFTDPETAGAAFDAVDALVGVYSDLADEIGVSTQEFVNQLQSVSNLAAAHSDLRSAIDGTKSALQLMNEQQNIVAGETRNFEEALAELTTGGGSLPDVAGAMRNLTLEYAGSGVSASQAIAKQRELRAALIEAGVAAGGNRAEVAAMVDQLGLVPEAVLAEVVLEAEKFYAENEQVQEDLRETGRRYDAEIGLIDLASLPLDVVLASLNDYTVQDWIANLDANNQKALAAVAGATAETATWDDILAVADLDADGVLAESELLRLVQLIENYKISDNTTSLDADGSFAQNEIERMEALARGYVGRDNTAKLKADGTQAKNEISDRQKQANDLAKSYQIRIQALDLASGTLANIRRYYDNIPNTKTITVRTRSGIIQADGGIITRMARGGILPGQVSRLDAGAVMDRAVPARPGTAQIYRPITPGRFFAEPETGGEAYIPLAPWKRARSMRILEETASIMGATVIRENSLISRRAPGQAMADGGILRTQSFATGGITTGVVQTDEGDLPTVVVAVQVDTKPLADMEVDLSPANESIRKTVALLDRAKTAADAFGLSGQKAGESVELPPSALANSEGIGRAPGLTRSATVTIDAPVDVQIVATPGMDETRVAALAGEAVRRGLDDFAADLENLFT